MNKKFIFALTFLASILFSDLAVAQKYWVKFKNKNGTPYTTSTPEQAMCKTISPGLPESTNCDAVNPGINREGVWFFNHSEAAPSAVTNGVFDTITMDATKVAYRVYVDKGSARVQSTFEPAELGGGTYTYTFSFKIARVAASDVNWADGLNNWNGMVVAQTKSNTFPALGVQGIHDPLTISVNKYDTDEGEFGLTVEMTCTGNSKHPPHFFDTDLTTTKAALVDLETA